MAEQRVRLVVLDGYTLNPGDVPWDGLARLGELTVHDRTPPELARERAAAAEVVLTNKVVLDAETIAALPYLRLICVLATGYNIVDLAAADARGIPVCNVPAYSTDSVAQLVFALLLELCHQVGHHSQRVHDGAWQTCRDFSFWEAPLIELAGLTFGIVGYGRIGKRVGELAHAFGMNVIASDPSPDDPPSWEPFAFVSVDEVFDLADVVSLHCPLTPATDGLVDAARLARMKPGAVLINTGRGPLVVEQDLADALAGGHLHGAAVDVVSREPITADNPLLTAPRCLLTPHIAWATRQARERLMAATVANVTAWQAGRPQNVVNQPAG